MDEAGDDQLEELEKELEDWDAGLGAKVGFFEKGILGISMDIPICPENGMI